MEGENNWVRVGDLVKVVGERDIDVEPRFVFLATFNIVHLGLQEKVWLTVLVQNSDKGPVVQD